MGTSQVTASQLLECRQPLLHGQPHGVQGSDQVPLSLHVQKYWRAHRVAHLEPGTLDVVH